MSDADESSKTEEPTAKKRNEAMEKGQFAKSPDVGVVMVMVAAFSVFVFNGYDGASRVGLAAHAIFSQLAHFDANPANVVNFFVYRFREAFEIVFPLLIACFSASILAGGLQSGFKLTPKVVELKTSNLNPANGLKKIFSIQSLFQFVIDLAKFIAVGWIIYGALKEIQNEPIFHTTVDIAYVGKFLMDTFLLLLARLITALGVIAALHYILQRYKTTKDLRMTKQEVRDEMKDQEGNPHVKGAQRAMARRLLMNQMMDDIPMADVVVTNPTHYAVALKYETGKDLAPVVIAKGENLFAQRIKKIAKENGVPMVENKPVARILFRVGKVGKPIPAEMYQAVAEILSYVYKAHKYYFHRLKTRRMLKK
ncbi:MAG: type III secretion protein [Verrucomicrobia bacterium CG_4_10_14_3_um_filter_43_23]|nr:MAG: type III secretion protein [Verrucomicrobia bacterium CG1_02_43_26]PIP59943.1 MAG: type III secretion protein [Verrucomicrobia bacterium CG22_combo_CG10-13_8_21_14_all_43_17]PIX58147.1 MAG: type III secretion protein [Verrucomicrobia bacterium CG_4_10_14_3_um_filter_43_23]PIY61854.1 MAG: type III secretion protein [Verrucomicrobia bacterium CG_4_10_14_0_8_um_filter_43_34]PJA44475.1 MAG: type III secretion protein [Verrucomicrobia bacterium CG_4_9_14_3_um_filter_43_20]